MVGVYDNPRIPWSSHVQVEVATGDQTSDTEVQLMSASPPCVLLGPSYQEAGEIRIGYTDLPLGGGYPPVSGV